MPDVLLWHEQGIVTKNTFVLLEFIRTVIFCLLQAV